MPGAELSSLSYRFGMDILEKMREKARGERGDRKREKRE